LERQAKTNATASMSRRCGAIARRPAQTARFGESSHGEPYLNAAIGRSASRSRMPKLAGLRAPRQCHRFLRVLTCYSTGRGRSSPRGGMLWTDATQPAGRAHAPALMLAVGRVLVRGRPTDSGATAAVEAVQPARGVAGPVRLLPTRRKPGPVWPLWEGEAVLRGRSPGDDAMDTVPARGLRRRTWFRAAAPSPQPPRRGTSSSSGEANRSSTGHRAARARRRGG